MAEIIKKVDEFVDTNPAIITKTKSADSLIIETTYREPKVKREVINIADLEAKIAKIDNVIAQWESKKKPYQDQLDTYNQLN